MSQVLLFSLRAALNPTLLTATTVMLLLPHPKRLLLGYLLGAYMTSITLGLVVVFALQDSGAVDTAEDTLGPAADIALGLILLIVAFVLHSGRHEARLSRHKEKKAERQEKTPRWQKFLSTGRSRDTFVVGALLSFPGASYLAALREISAGSKRHRDCAFRDRLQHSDTGHFGDTPSGIRPRAGLDAESDSGL